MTNPTNAEIMNAIVDLRRHFDGRLDAIAADVAVLKADNVVLKADVAGLKADVAGLKTDVAGLKADTAALKAGQFDIRADIRVINARLDEQRQTINAMIPTKLAAVPSSDERRAS